jgi:hypothetical protein
MAQRNLGGKPVRDDNDRPATFKKKGLDQRSRKRLAGTACFGKDQAMDSGPYRTLACDLAETAAQDLGVDC